ncbi:unnamed protein product [Acanthosepion pharaonis]|uniref:Transmembrane protein n=1 Tax=Acanthosepion pharaonis TaxID=158019 RepID=A0A812B1J8_ACAPH|nr:unnamed protein product [Sepia pharaonis]
MLFLSCRQMRLPFQFLYSFTCENDKDRRLFCFLPESRVGEILREHFTLPKRSRKVSLHISLLSALLFVLLSALLSVLLSALLSVLLSALLSVLLSALLSASLDTSLLQCLLRKTRSWSCLNPSPFRSLSNWAAATLPNRYHLPISCASHTSHVLSPHCSVLTPSIHLPLLSTTHFIATPPPFNLADSLQCPIRAFSRPVPTLACVLIYFFLHFFSLVYRRFGPPPIDIVFLCYHCCSDY